MPLMVDLPEEDEEEVREVPTLISADDVDELTFTLSKRQARELLTLLEDASSECAGAVDRLMAQLNQQGVYTGVDEESKTLLGTNPYGMFEVIWLGYVHSKEDSEEELTALDLLQQLDAVWHQEHPWEPNEECWMPSEFDENNYTAKYDEDEDEDVEEDEG